MTTIAKHASYVSPSQPHDAWRPYRDEDRRYRHRHDRLRRAAQRCKDERKIGRYWMQEEEARADA